MTDPFVPPFCHRFCSECVQMASRGIASLHFGAALFVFTFLPCAVTGTELAINGKTTDFRLPTEPGLAQSLWCTVRDPSQPQELLWFRENKKVKLQDGNKVNASNICVSPVTVDDNGVSFTCQLARNASAQISVMLDVMFEPILSGDDLSSVQEEEDVTLNCHARANPPAQMRWYKGNSSLTLESSRYWVSQTSGLFQLVIQRVQKSDGGIYTCMAETDSRNETWDFHLVVTDRTLPFPTEAVIMAAVVVVLTALFAVVARRERIIKCFKKESTSPNNTAL
ncbi:transmembrane and immunoglobulin domain-containing protein 1 [Elgaria multicarinata webbii]|uniref:transmembrane and immunoglobulin domain-containing protein 1 n=1 Tax=Elgaria multicarinata webbii TaxID=159646 RepID=UPI002FCD48F2